MTRATVVVPTFNGEDYLEDLLTAVEAQEFDGQVEVLVIDSGSTDATLSILSRHEVRLVQIPNSEFGHGRTRARAVELATGDFIAFLTQDAIPEGVHWLAELLAPFALDEKVAVVTGRQKPRPRAFPLQKYDIIHTFLTQGNDASISVFGGAPYPLNDKDHSTSTFHSDVNAAVRRSLALSELPFRDVPYSEDQVMAQEALEKGFWKAYAGRAVVVHSNDLTFREYGKRVFEETVALRRIGHDFHSVSLFHAGAAVATGAFGDSLRIVRDKDYHPGEKLRWLLINPAYHVRRWSNVWRAAHVDLDDHDRLRANSLEHERKGVGAD